ncbi:MAG: ABC transporter permease [Lachnospiraceae bacterium]|nr:ABC transporter permease [Lachnospiraceae bacterium]
MLRNNNQAVIAKMAKNSLKSNKRRNGILIFAIVLAVFMLFTVLTTGETYFRMQKTQNIRLQGGDFDALLYGGFTEKQKEICEENPQIKEVGTEVMCAWAVKTKYDQTLHSVFIWSDDTSWNQIKGAAIETIEGHYPQKDNEVMTTKEALEDAGLGDLKVGDTFTMTYADKIGEHTKDFTISGLWDGYGDTKTFYVSKSFSEQSGFTFSDVGRGFVYVKFQSPLVTNHITQSLEQSLHLNKKQRLIVTADTAMSIQILIGVIGLILITCVSAYLLIYNIMYMSISGNVRYYGLLATIGMSEKQIYQYVQRQMLIIGAIGTGVGILIGAITSLKFIPAIVKTLGIRESTQMTLHPLVLILCTAIALITIYFGSRKPAKMATRISPIEALGYQRISANKHSQRKRKKGNLVWRMAWEQFTKDKKKTAMVLITLGISLSFFLCMVTLIQSQGPRTIVSNYMDNDLVIKNDIMQMSEESKWKPVLSDDLLQQIKHHPAVKETHAVTNAQIVIPWEKDFMEYWMNEFYETWMDEKYQDVKADYQNHPEKYFSYLVGIDDTEFQYLNQWFTDPMNEQDFKKGKTCILITNDLKLQQKKVIGKSISYSLFQGDKQYQMTIQGMTNDSYYSNLLGTTPTLIVSDRFLKKIVPNAYVSKLGVRYEKEYDPSVEKDIQYMLKNSQYPKDYSYESKLEELKTVTKAQGNMMRIGIGIAFILAFIGIMNYLNTSVGNVQSRQQEFAVLESIGMTNRQLRQMLTVEGILYAGSSILITATFGLGVTYSLYQSMNYRDVAFTIPVLPIVMEVFVVCMVCIFIPVMAYQNMEKKGSIVERIRRNE